MWNWPLASPRTFYWILLRTSSINDRKLHQAPKICNIIVYHYTKSQNFISNHSKKIKLWVPHTLNSLYTVRHTDLKILSQYNASIRINSSQNQNSLSQLLTKHWSRGWCHLAISRESSPQPTPVAERGETIPIPIPWSATHCQTRLRNPTLH